MDLVGIEQSAVLGEEIGLRPRITACGGNGVVGIAPIAFTPVAGDVADAGMRGGSGKARH